MSAGHAASSRGIHQPRAFALGIAFNVGFRRARGRVRIRSRTRWPAVPTQGTICPMCSGWLVGLRGQPRWPGRLVAAIHLRTQEGVDPRRADQRFVPVWSQSARSAPKRSGGCFIRHRLKARIDRGRRLSAIPVNGVTAWLFARGHRRHQRARRVSSHGRPTPRSRPQWCSPASSSFGPARLDRSGHQPRRLAGDPVGEHGAAQGIGRNVARWVCRAGLTWIWLNMSSPRSMGSRRFTTSMCGR